MFSVVIRNKNESEALRRILPILIHQYKDDFNEIILVDNYSSDNSVEIAKSFNCKIEYIKDFTYGRAINLGLSKAENKYILLLSAHALPVGKSFFKTSLVALEKDSKIAGLRYINSMKNYELAFKNNFVVNKSLEHGLMAACAMVNKEVWLNHKFDELLPASEDKEWSLRVMKNDFKIMQVPETYFYFALRNQNKRLKRFSIETTAETILRKSRPPTYRKIILVSFYNIIFKSTLKFLKNVVYEIQLLKIKLKIRQEVIRYNRNNKLNP